MASLDAVILAHKSPTTVSIGEVVDVIVHQPGFGVVAAAEDDQRITEFKVHSSARLSDRIGGLQPARTAIQINERQWDIAFIFFEPL